MQTIPRWSLFVLPMAMALLFVCEARAETLARVVARAHDGETQQAGPVQARVGEAVELSVRLADGGPLPDGATVRWLTVIPLMDHEDLPPPNPGNQAYSNTVLYGPEHGKWLGFDTLEYRTAELLDKDGRPRTEPTLTVTRAASTIAGIDHRGAGSNWFAAQVQLPDGQTIRTPDGDDLDNLGLAPEVMRVSYRLGDDYLGWLGTYFNVPDVFGSAGPTDARHQTDRYTGTDCADVLVGALRAAGHTEIGYTSISGLGTYATPISDALLMDADGLSWADAETATALRWGEEVRPGDLLVINYEDDPDGQLPRSWDHIGALVEDRGPTGPDGVLNGYDLLRHVTAQGLDDRRLKTQAPMRYRIWRWKIADEFPASCSPESLPQASTD
jgi:hypothetical protein